MLSIHELAKTVSTEPKLVYYLLKLINSPPVGTKSHFQR